MKNKDKTDEIQKKYEWEVIGSILQDETRYKIAEPIITHNDFLLPAHRLIYQYIKKLHDKGEPIAPLTLSKILDEGGNLDKSGGLVYLFELAKNATAPEDNFTSHCQQLNENANKSQLLNKIYAAIENHNSSFESLSSNIIQIMDGVNNAKLTSELDKKLGNACLPCPQLAALEIPEQVGLLPWLLSSGTAMIFAKAGVGKTMFALSAAYALTSLKEFMGWKIGKNVGVLYVDGEMMLSAMRERLFNFIPDKKSLPENLVLLSHQQFYKETKMDLSISKRENQAAFLNWLEKHKQIEVIIFDNLSSLCDFREDKADDWREFMKPFILRLKDRGVSTILIHHAGKNGEQRGASGRTDLLDSVIKLTAMDEDDKEGAHFKATFEKSRGFCGEDAEPRIAKLITEPSDKDNCWHWKISSVDKNTKQKLIKLIDETGGITCTEAAKELEISQPQISKYRRTLEKEGIIEKSITNQSPMTLAVGYKSRGANNEK